MHIDNRENEMRMKICTICNGNLSGELYYCSSEDCAGTFPLCYNCLCQECGKCTLCCLCLVQEWGSLFCRSCGQVETHRRTRSEVWCAVCTTEYDEEQISTIEKWLEGVDGDFLARVANAKEDRGILPAEDKEYAEAVDRDVVFCRDCSANTPHEYTGTGDGTNVAPQPQMKCKTCGAVRFGRWRLYEDGSVEDVDGKRVYSARELDGDDKDGGGDDPHDTKKPVNASQASYGSQWYGQQGYGTCHHWKEPVKVGEYTVLCSAAGDRGTAKDTDPKPDYGVYLTTMGWGMRVMVSPDFPAKELHLVLPYPRLTLDWIDMMAAPRGAATEHVIRWTAEKIVEGKLVDIGCFGGHGRTGTLLAVLLVEVEKLSPADAIEAVRKRYCGECIESKAQAQFVYEWAGERMPFSAWPTHTYTKPYVPEKYKYKSRKEKKESKKARRKRRKDFANQIKQAKEAGKTRRDFESEGKYWRCGECSTVRRDNSPRGMKEPNVKWWTWCPTCEQHRQHERPLEVFNELGGN